MRLGKAGAAIVLLHAGEAKACVRFRFYGVVRGANSRGLDEACVGTQRKPSKILGSETVLSMRFTVRICCKSAIYPAE